MRETASGFYFNIMTKEQYIERVNKLYNNFYDYSNSEFLGTKKPITIVCPLHGEFTLLAGNHLNKNCRCKECVKNDRTSQLESKIGEFIEKAKEIHQDKYNYEKAEYVGSHEKLSIICPIHGEFRQAPTQHLLGRGCSKCGAAKRGIGKRTTQEEFLEKSIQIHNNKYDYSKCDVITSHTKVEIICPIHGGFMQAPTQHMKGQGCPKCRYDTIAEKISLTPDEVITNFRKTHGDRYDYSKVKYISQHKKVEIICKKHGSFIMTPANHTHGQKCHDCSLEDTSEKFSYTIDDFLRKCEEKHGQKYDYSKVDFVDIYTPVEIICPIHGSVWQKPVNHYNNGGCPKCGQHTRDTHDNKETTEHFINKSRQIHGDRYNYDNSIYKGNDIDIEIICPTHGSFWQLPTNHYKGCNCPKCSNGQSKWEMEIFNYIVSLNINVEKSRKIISPYEIDMFLKDYNFGIEANGLWFHSEKYVSSTTKHLDKTEMCAAKGVELFHIFEDEWYDKKDIITSMINNRLGKNQVKIFARKCEIKEISYEDAKNFIVDNHLQGASVSSYNLGLFYDNTLVSVMTFAVPRYNKKYEWELIRFCNKRNTTVIGGANKMIKFFIKTKNPISIISYANKRFSKGKIYEIMGFSPASPDTKPNYYYINRGNRYSRLKFQKHKLHKLLDKFDETLSEKQNMENNGYYRIWDCGNKVYTWRNSLSKDSAAISELL